MQLPKEFRPVCIPGEGTSGRPKIVTSEKTAVFSESAHVVKFNTAVTVREHIGYQGQRSRNLRSRLRCA